MDAVRYEITYMSPKQKGMQRLPVKDYSDAAHRAVRLMVDDGCSNIIVKRFDPVTGWDIVGIARRFPSRLHDSDVVACQDGRTSVQRLQDTLRCVDRVETLTAVEAPRGHRSGMRVWGAARAIRADRKRLSA